MMKSIAVLAVAALLTSGATVEPNRVHAAGLRVVGAGAVNVTVHYKGKGTVDSAHRVWVWVFDTPDIGPGAMPIAEMSVAKNGESAVFEVANERVWVAVAYDEQGVMTGNTPPGSGSPVGIYASASGAPEAVSPGAKGAITIVFDDSRRLP